MNEEQKLKITEVKKGDKVYKNVKLNEIEDGNYVLAEKIFAEGMKFATKFGDKFACKAKIAGEVVSFWLKPKVHDLYKECGGVGDIVKISGKEVKIVNPKTKVKMFVINLSFEKVEV